MDRLGKERREGLGLDVGIDGCEFHPAMRRAECREECDKELKSKLISNSLKDVKSPLFWCSMEMPRLRCR